MTDRPGAPALDLARLDLDSFRGRPVAVLGLARSGIALGRFLYDRGARVTIYDRRSLADLTEAVAELGGRDIRLLVGPDVDPAEALQRQDLVATSPSVNSRYPTTEPRLRAALAAIEETGRTPVISEIDLFLRLCPAVTIGVTGTKGKTTTASLAAAVLQGGSSPVVLGGNIGQPLVERLPELTPRDRVVVELSELQLPTLSRGTTVAVYTHVTADHLDRHGTTEAYRAVKRRLAELLPDDGAIVLNDEDPVTRLYEAAEGTVTIRYRRRPPPVGGLGVEDGWIVADGTPRLPAADRPPEAGGGAATSRRTSGRILPVEEIGIAGEHNISNVLAAVAVGLLFGIEPAAIRDAVAAFQPVPHRLEPVATIEGVRYVDDSQGTQPDAVIAALRSFPKPLVLIAGGRDKGVPLEDLAAVVVERTSAVVLIGESADRLAGLFGRAGHRRVERAPDMDAAVARADEIARDVLEALDREAGAIATVLLSPAAASFDMFVDYAARGDAFRDSVARVAARRAGTTEQSDKGSSTR